MEQPTPFVNQVLRRLADSPVPRPVLCFAGLILLLAGIRTVIGEAGANRPASVALAVGDGLMSVFHDDESLKNMTLIFTKNGRNNDGTVELRGVGAGLGSLLFGGTPRVGGNLYFHQYSHKSGIVLDGGPLDIELTNATAGQERASHFKVQGSLSVVGSNQPASVQIDFISPEKSYEVTQLSGTVTINGTNTSILP